MRDMSAFTTLDNANMGNDFDKWANRNGLVSTVAREVAGTGWNARQTEIDALKMELIETRSELVKSGMERLSLMAELERLKVDSERYRWLRETIGDRSEIYVKTNDHDDYWEEPTTQQLDVAIDAAMKDFSTRQKEEGE